MGRLSFSPAPALRNCVPPTRRWHSLRYRLTPHPAAGRSTLRCAAPTLMVTASLIRQLLRGDRRIGRRSGVSARQRCRVCRVRDTLLALQMMGQAARRQFAGPVVAITGSNGKTTTRQLTASVLRAHFGDDAVLCTEGQLQQPYRCP